MRLRTETHCLFSLALCMESSDGRCLAGRRQRKGGAVAYNITRDGDEQAASSTYPTAAESLKTVVLTEGFCLKI